MFAVLAARQGKGCARRAVMGQGKRRTAAKEPGYDDSKLPEMTV